ncbi:hypothetical protein HPP92_011690 [Vanilla planifolia]|uniref:Uncharacterized protein n=1 Tax=Vanilla planifolia TaxID=51239 RepID=A0A835V0F3_VANPL|nr:hypothetical protein HPP92_011690 [Vanilla planifolia]
MLAGKVGSFGEEGGVGGGYVYSGKKGWELADKGISERKRRVAPPAAVTVSARTKTPAEASGSWKMSERWRRRRKGGRLKSELAFLLKEE